MNNILQKKSSSVEPQNVANLNMLLNPPAYLNEPKFMSQALDILKDKLKEAQLKQINQVKKESEANERKFSDIFFTFSHLSTDKQQELLKEIKTLDPPIFQ